MDGKLPRMDIWGIYCAASLYTARPVRLYKGVLRRCGLLQTIRGASEVRSDLTRPPFNTELKNCFKAFVVPKSNIYQIVGTRAFLFEVIK
jgi:hypothetical protein